MRGNTPDMDLTTQAEVTVLILTRDRDDTLAGAIESVLRQDYTGGIRVTVIGDNCGKLPAQAIGPPSPNRTIEAFDIESNATFRNLPTVARVSRLRNMSLALVDTPYVCFLDDDNRWLSDHVSSLVSLINSRDVQAVHSWRRLTDQNGAPWVPTCFPWHTDEGKCQELFEIYTKLGMMSSDDLFRDTYVAFHDDRDYGVVDMGAWLFDSQLIKTVRFDTEYSEADIISTTTEDVKLLHALKRHGCGVDSTQNASLVYRLGGFSNRFSKS